MRERRGGGGPADRRRQGVLRRLHAPRDEDVQEAPEPGLPREPVLVPPVAGVLGGRLEDDQRVGMDRDRREERRVELRRVVPGREFADVDGPIGLAAPDRALGPFLAGHRLQRAARRLTPRRLVRPAVVVGRLAVLDEGQTRRLEEPREVLVEAGDHAEEIPGLVFDVGAREGARVRREEDAVGDEGFGQRRDA